MEPKLNMHIHGPIIVIDDDAEDLELIGDALRSLEVKNEVAFFQDAYDSIDYLTNLSTKPFLILCDVNMSQMSGFELREALIKNESLGLKSLPFLFLSTSSYNTDVTKAYKLSAHGYFRKPDNFEDIKQMLQSIISYWQTCLHPLPLVQSGT